MNPTLLRLAALVALLAVACAFGIVRRRHDGRVRAEAGGVALGADRLGQPLGTRATLVQFSTSFCAPCRAARRVLGEFVARRPGVHHVEVDAETSLDLVRELDVRRTPTVLVLDGRGRVVSRTVGVPTAAQLDVALAGVALEAGRG